MSDRFFSSSRRARSTAKSARRKLGYETLERRALLAAATDLQVITGRIFADTTGNGYNAGEEVAGATANLYRDNGDGVFNAAVDAVFKSATTGSDGTYRISGVTAGSYFVEQPSQTISGRTLAQRVSTLITVSSDDAAGQLQRTIDSFNAGTQLVFDDTNNNTPVTSSVQAPTTDVIGGERDLLVSKTSTNGRVQLSVNDPLLPGLLSFDSIQTGQGRRVISWDGIDNDANVINDAGLAGIDLTSSGAATGLKLQIGADQSGGTVTIRLYSNDGVAGTAGRFSSGTFALPNTGGTATAIEFLPFTGFAATSGGGADLTSIGAIEMEISGTSNVNGSAELVGSIGPTTRSFDFANFESADLRLAQTASSSTVVLNQNVTFNVTVTNDGPNTASAVVVRSLLNAGFTFISAQPSQGTYSSSDGRWTLGSLANGASATLAIIARANASGTLIHTSEVFSSTAFDADSTPGNGTAGEDDIASSSVAVQAADLSLTNAVDRTSARIGDNVTYTVVLSNAGPSTATGISVNAALPTGLTLVSNTPSVGTYTNSIWTVDSLAIGSTATLTIVGRVDTNGAKSLTAQVTAAGQPDPDSTPNNNVVSEDDQATASVDVSSANLSLTMNASSTTPNVNENVTFTLNVRNSGPDNATGVTVRDLLPSGLTFVSSTQGSAYNATTGIWTIGSLASGANATLQIVATPTTGGAFINTAEIQTADQQDANSIPGNGIASEDDQASVTINAQSIDLSLTKTVNNANPDRGGTITLTTTLTNAGPSTATGITVRDAVPSGFTYQNGSASVGTYTNSNGIWTIPSLAAGATATLTMTLLVNTSNATTFTAEVTAANQTDIDSTPNNGAPAEDDQASVQVTVPTADLSLTLAASTNKPNVGANVTFTLTVANSGPSTAPGVIVSSVLPAGFTFVSSTPSQGNYVSSTGRWNVGTIAIDGTATLQIIARVDNSTAKTVNAEVVASDRFDPDSTPGNNIATEDDQATVQITPQRVDLSLAMTASPIRANVGQNVSYTLTLSNGGPDAATGIVVRDTLPQGLTFVSAAPSAGTFDSANGTWSVPSLGTGSAATLTLVATYDVPRQIINTAEVTAVDQFDTDSTPNNNATNEDDQASVQITPASADLSLTQTVSTASPNFGQSVSFTITLANLGPDAATGVTVLDLLPAELAFVSSSPSLGTYDPVTGIWNVGTLAAAGRATLTITATPTTTGAKTNTAQVRTADQFDPDSTPGNSLATEDDQATVTVTPQQIDLALTTTVDRPSPNIGENVTYRISLTNAGPSTATGIRVRDLLPTGTSFVSATASSGSYVASTGIWSPAALAANATATLSIVARVTAPGLS